jgi:hypothetical protein
MAAAAAAAAAAAIAAIAAIAAVAAVNDLLYMMAVNMKEELRRRK